MIKTQPIVKFFDHIQTSNIFTNLIVDTCGVQQGYICRAHLFLQESSPLGKLFSRKAAHLENFVRAGECKRAPSGKLQKKNMISKKWGWMQEGVGAFDLFFICKKCLAEFWHNSPWNMVRLKNTIDRWLVWFPSPLAAESDGDLV